MSAVIAAVGIGTSVAASEAQSSSNKRAQQIQQQQFAETKAALEKANKEAQGYIKPYADVGGSALNELAYGMGLTTPTEGYTSANTQQGGLANFNYGQDQYQKDVGYTPMVTDLASLQATPGYQFQLEQGLQGVNNTAAARGGLLSGANIKAINDYAQGQASTGYQNAWERAQNAYTNAFGRSFNTQQQKFTNLQSMANNGQNAAGNQGQYAMTTGTALAGASTNFGNNMGNLALGQGQNQANMINGIGGAVGGAASRAMGLMGGFGGGSSSSGGGGSSAGLSGLASGNAPSSMVNWGYNPQLNQIKGLG